MDKRNLKNNNNKQKQHVKNDKQYCLARFIHVRLYVEWCIVYCIPIQIFNANIHKYLGKQVDT